MTLNLADLSLSDDPSKPRKWVFPTGSTLAGGARWVVEFDDTQPASATNTGFALRAAGDSVLLYQRPADGGAQLDSITFGLQATDFSLARVPGGSGGWT